MHKKKCITHNELCMIRRGRVNPHIIAIGKAGEEVILEEMKRKTV